MRSGDVVDVVFAYSRVGGCQIQQVVVPGLGALQLVLRIFCLPLEEGKMDVRAKPLMGGIWDFLHGQYLQSAPHMALGCLTPRAG